MAGDCSFDIVSQFDEQELVNALDQTRREVQTRYDLKDTKTEIARSQDTITILTDSSLTLKNVRDILESKAIRRQLSLKIFKPGKEENAAGGKVRQIIQLQQGLSPELAKEIIMEGTRKTRKAADETMRLVRHAMKIDYFPGTDLEP